MKTCKFSATCYVVILRNPETPSVEYIAGTVRAEINRIHGRPFWWLFYPSGSIASINAWDLQAIGEFVTELNDELILTREIER